MSGSEKWYRFQELPPNILAKIDQLNSFFQKEDILLAYLFGSLRTQQTGQDVDLAILTKQTPVFRLFEKITDCLETQRVDLIDLRKATPILRFEIIETGKLIYAINDDVVEDFEMATIHLYRDTAPMRHRQNEYLRRKLISWSSNKPALKND